MLRGSRSIYTTVPDEDFDDEVQANFESRRFGGGEKRWMSGDSDFSRRFSHEMQDSDDEFPPGLFSV